MPIQRIARRAQTLQASDYICHSCRHRLLARPLPSPRWQSNLSTPSRDDAGDDWLSNFNNLPSVAHRPNKLKSRLDTSSLGIRGSGNATQKEKSSDGREDAIESDQHDGADKPLASVSPGDVGDAGFVDEAGEASAGKSLPAKRGVDFTRLQASLSQSLESLDSSAPATEARSISQPTMQDQDQLASSSAPGATSFASPKRHRPRKRRPNGAESGARKAAERLERKKSSVDRLAGSYDAPSAAAPNISPTNPPRSEMRRKFEDIIQSLSKTVSAQLQDMLGRRKSLSKKGEAQATLSGVPAGNDAEIDSATQIQNTAQVEASQASVPLSVDNEPLHATQTTAVPREDGGHQKTKRPREPSSLSDGDFALPMSGISFALRSASSPSLATKVRELKSRPKWGGTSTTPEDSDANSSFLRSLHQAHPRDYVKQVTSTPFGVANAVFASSPADLAENSEISWEKMRTPPQTPAPALTPKQAGLDISALQPDLLTELDAKSGSEVLDTPAKGQDAVEEKHNAFPQELLDGTLVQQGIATGNGVTSDSDMSPAPAVPAPRTPRPMKAGPRIVKFPSDSVSSNLRPPRGLLGLAKTPTPSEGHSPSTVAVNNSQREAEVRKNISAYAAKTHTVETMANDRAHGKTAGNASERLASRYGPNATDDSAHGRKDVKASHAAEVTTTKSSTRVPPGRRERMRFTEQAAQREAASPTSAAANTDSSSANGVNGGNGGDDSEHKPLWEVMAKADALTTNVATEANETEQSENTDEVDPPPMDLSRSEPADADVLTIKPSALLVNPLNIPQPTVPGLAYGLDRVLFNPGVYQLQDPLSRVYNFDPYLQKIMPVTEFDFNALKEYKTSSQDTILSSLAKEHGKRYIGSTSSMTSTLGHFHYLLSDWRPINLSMLSRGFSDRLDSFTQINRAPNAMFLRWKNGTYAIDADKQYDSGNVLMLLGKSMEKLLTTSTSEYERYRKSDPRSVSEEERSAPEAFEYTTMGDFLMRSQLDAHDPRLPGTGMFDLKTRAVVSVRMESEDFKPMTGYEIYSLQGRFGSYEREYYDMMRSTMLKYMLQARMGRMDGIFVAYHNVERIFGFQYLPIQELDRALHGQVDPCLGDQEFKASLDLLNKVLDKATAKFPEQSLRFHFETSSEALGGGNPTTLMWIFAEPMSENDIDRIQATSKAKIAEFERTMMGVEEQDEKVEGEGPALQNDAAHASASATSSVAESAETSTAESTSTSDDSAESSSEYVSSRSNADPVFIESIAASQDRKPLFAASLICKSRINGISQPRPQGLKRTDSWEVEYLLREWEAPDAMWARYEQMKARRKEMFEKFKNEDEDAADAAGNGGEITPKQKKERSFIDFLKSMSQSGREFRSKMDELEAGKVPVVVGQPRPVAAVAAAGEQEKMEGVKD